MTAGKLDERSPSTNAEEDPRAGVAARSVGAPARVLAWLRHDALGSVVALLIVALVLAPLLVLLPQAFRLSGEWSIRPLLDVVGEDWFWPSVRQTVSVVLLAVAGAVVVGTFLAWVNERTDASLGVLGDLLPMLPLFLPPIAMVIGWTFLALPDVGYLNSFVFNPLGLSVDIYTLPGMAFCYVLFLVPFVFVIVSSALGNLDSSLEEASRVSGAGRLHTLLRITIPAIKPALLNAVLLSTVTALALYSIPAVLGPNAGIDILTARLVNSLRTEFPPRIDVAVALAAVFLVVLVPLWAMAQHFGRSVAVARLEGKQSSKTVVSLGNWRWPVRLVGGLYILISSVLPASALLLVSLQPFWSGQIAPGEMTLRHYRDVFSDPGMIESVLNSLQLATLGTILLLAVTALLAIHVRRRPSRWRTLVDGVQRLPAAVSNIVIGVAIILTLAGPPFGLHSTLWILLIGYVIINMPQASIAAGSAAAQVGDDLIGASRVCNASNLRTMLRVDLPLMWRGLVSGATMLFVLIAGDLTASSILSSNTNPVIGFMLLDIFETGTYGQLAALAVVVVGIFAVISTIGFVYTRARLARQGR